MDTKMSKIFLGLVLQSISATCAWFGFGGNIGILALALVGTAWVCALLTLFRVELGAKLLRWVSFPMLPISVFTLSGATDLLDAHSRGQAQKRS